MTKKQVENKIKKYKQLLAKHKPVLDEADNRIAGYIGDVFAEPKKHNKYELLMIYRTLDMLNDQTIYFNTKKVSRFFKFYEFSKFPSQEGMKAFKLTPIQAFIFANIYGLYNRNDNTRVIRNALLFFPRKWSKTTAVAAVAEYDLLFGDADAQAYIASNSFNQSKICFDIISNSLRQLDPNNKAFRRNRDIIYSLMPNRSSLIRCLSSKADKLDGLNASTVIMDEYAQSETQELMNVLTSSMGTRKNPLTIVITTASTKLTTPFTTMLNAYKQVLENNIQSRNIFAAIFEPDEGDDYGAETTWEKVQPHLGVTVNKAFYRSEWEKAQLNADDKTNFLTKLLNVFVQDISTKWIDKDVILKYTKPLRLSKLKTRPKAFVAVDLSVKDDFSVVCYALYDSLNHRFYFTCDFYIPKNTANNHHNSEMYKELVKNGKMKICGNDVIDYTMIANDIIGNAKYVDIVNLGYDPYKSKDFINVMRTVGMKNLTPVSQTLGSFSPAVAAFEYGVYNGNYQFDDNPLILYCFNNVAMDVDKMENRKPMKKTANDKIDAVITILMCILLAMNTKRQIF